MLLKALRGVPLCIVMTSTTFAFSTENVNDAVMPNDMPHHNTLHQLIETQEAADYAAFMLTARAAIDESLSIEYLTKMNHALQNVLSKLQSPYLVTFWQNLSISTCELANAAYDKRRYDFPGDEGAVLIADEGLQKKIRCATWNIE